MSVYVLVGGGWLRSRSWPTLSDPCCLGMVEADEAPNRFLIALAVLELLPTLLPTQPSAPLLLDHFRRREARARRPSRTCPERWLSLLLFPREADT
jgi:hypothetical protein